MSLMNLCMDAKAWNNTEILFAAIDHGIAAFNPSYSVQKETAAEASRYFSPSNSHIFLPSARVAFATIHGESQLSNLPPIFRPVR